MMVTELLPETWADLEILTKLSAGKNFVDFCRRERFKTFSENIAIEFKKIKVQALIRRHTQTDRHGLQI
jgi:hypothetical protein